VVLKNTSDKKDAEPWRTDQSIRLLLGLLGGRLFGRRLRRQTLSQEQVTRRGKEHGHERLFTFLAAFFGAAFFGEAAFFGDAALTGAGAGSGSAFLAGAAAAFFGAAFLVAVFLGAVAFLVAVDFAAGFFAAICNNKRSDSTLTHRHNKFLDIC
jgi:hypothetical protein